MLVVSFRDMTTRQCSAVTTAAIYDVAVPNANPIWNPAPRFTLRSWADLGETFHGKHVCFVVHGFNVNRDRGYTGLGAFSQELGPFGALAGLLPPHDLHLQGFDLVVPVLWSGDWYLPINYPFLLPDVRLTGQYFADLILSSATRMSRVSFFTHSMGARVVLEAVQQTMAQARDKGWTTPVFETAIFTAAATSDEVLDSEFYSDAVDAIGRFVVVSSRADTVLSGAFPLGNAVEQALWRNDPGADEALGRFGPRLKRGSKALGKTAWFDVAGRDATGASIAQDHGDYLPEPWNAVAGIPNGWSSKRIGIGTLAQAIFDNQTPPWPPEKTIVPR